MCSVCICETLQVEQVLDNLTLCFYRREHWCQHTWYLRDTVGDQNSQASVAVLCFIWIAASSVIIITFSVSSSIKWFSKIKHPTLLKVLRALLCKLSFCCLILGHVGNLQHFTFLSPIYNQNPLKVRNRLVMTGNWITSNPIDFVFRLHDLASLITTVPGKLQLYWSVVLIVHVCVYYVFKEEFLVLHS